MRDRGFTLGKGKSIVNFTNVPSDGRVRYRDASVELSGASESAGLNLEFAGASSLSVVNGWLSGVNPTLAVTDSLLLSLEESAAFDFESGGTYRIDSTSLGRLRSPHLRADALTVDPLYPVDEITLSSSVVWLGSVASVDRSSFTGVLTLNHTSVQSIVKIGVTDGIPQNVAINLAPGTTLRAATKLSEISSPNRIVISGTSALIIFEGNIPPAVFDITGTNITIQPSSLPKPSPTPSHANKLGSVAIVGIVVGVIGILVIGLLVWRLVVRRKQKPAWTYDRVPSTAKLMDSSDELEGLNRV
jgi:hypothetical protein